MNYSELSDSGLLDSTELDWAGLDWTQLDSVIALSIVLSGSIDSSLSVVAAVA